MLIDGVTTPGIAFVGETNSALVMLPSSSLCCFLIGVVLRSSSWAVAFGVWIASLVRIRGMGMGLFAEQSAGLQGIEGGSNEAARFFKLETHYPLRRDKGYYARLSQP